MARDEIFSKPLEKLEAFEFDDRVASVFPDMIQRSVPAYGAMLSLVSVLAAEAATDHSKIYDLGCSLGATTMAMASRISAQYCSIVAVDNSESMMARCQQNIAAAAPAIAIETRCEDIRHTEISNASVVSLILTLQFLPPAERLQMLATIYEGLQKDGVLLLAEKVGFENEAEQQFLSQSHEAFKRANGYSELEISQKRSVLENVLITETAAQHEQRLQQAGFSRVYRCFQAYNFMAWAAIK